MNHTKGRLVNEVDERLLEIQQSVKEAPSLLKKNDISYLVIKRAMDLVGSIVGLIFFTPIMLVIFLAIKLEDGGKVFFKQTRIGKDGKQFSMYKIRSMCMEAEQKLADLKEKNEVQGPMFKMKNDPRITKVGKFIRKTSLDELPQLINVLLGNMSLVGPRPPLPDEVGQYNAYEMQRLFVKPGCSGLWQISGRSDLHFKDMVELDLKYIRTRSIKLDCSIIIKTFLVILKPNGAY
ncbi:sugar transferase [Enterococcus sp. AZ109]|uniref:sugar transferase n=1 Tax=Enterococcus sp. AZ109 TaxID=2774634 RepID=UPI003F27F77D